MDAQSRIANRISLKQFAQEELSRQILDDIENIDIEIEVFEKIESGLSLNIGRKIVEIRIILRIPTKKLITWIGSLAVTAGGIVTVLKFLVPVLVDYFSKPPP